MLLPGQLVPLSVPESGEQGLVPERGGQDVQVGCEVKGELSGLGDKSQGEGVQFQTEKDLPTNNEENS